MALTNKIIAKRRCGVCFQASKFEDRKRFFPKAEALTAIKNRTLGIVQLDKNRDDDKYRQRDKNKQHGPNNVKSSIEN